MQCSAMYVYCLMSQKLVMLHPPKQATTHRNYQQYMKQHLGHYRVGILAQLTWLKLQHAGGHSYQTRGLPSGELT